jgi:methionine-rich copper-binding protein CopC
VKRSLLPLLLFSLVLGPGAQAHDSLVGQFPAVGEVVEAGVIELRLDFSSELMVIEGSNPAEIVISGPLPSTEMVNNGCAVAEGNIASTRVELVAPGTYQVAWRVVSEDGHPISGSYEFEVENTTGYQALGIEEVLCASSNTSENLAEQNQDSINYLLLWISLPLIGVGLLLFLWPRKRPRK